MSLPCDQVEEQLSGYLDGELTQQESQRVHQHLTQCEDCRALIEDLAKMKNDIGDMEQAVMSQQELNMIMNDKIAKGSGWLGWTVLIISLSCLVGFTAYQFWLNTETPLFLKLIISGVYGGITFLFLTVLRQRLIARKTDRYKGVDL